MSKPAPVTPNRADYVVVGSGSAGSIVARRLAESGASVVLLEAGGPDRTQLRAQARASSRSSTTSRS